MPCDTVPTVVFFFFHNRLLSVKTNPCPVSRQRVKVGENVNTVPLSMVLTPYNGSLAASASVQKAPAEDIQPLMELRRTDKSNPLRLRSNCPRWLQVSRVRERFARWRRAHPGLPEPVWRRFKCASPFICKTPAPQIYSGGILNYGNIMGGSAFLYNKLVRRQKENTQ